MYWLLLVFINRLFLILQSASSLFYSVYFLFLVKMAHLGFLKNDRKTDDDFKWTNNIISHSFIKITLQYSDVSPLKVANKWTRGTQIPIGIRKILIFGNGDGYGVLSAIPWYMASHRWWIASFDYNYLPRSVSQDRPL